MTTITTREIGASPKGSPLTNTEVDQNFINLNTDKAEKASPTFTGTVTLPTSLLNVTTSSYPTIRPSLNLDFANSQSVDPRITFTRASTATRVNANCLIEVVASNSPRIDFDPETDVCKGLLIEEQRTNLLTYSENFDNAVWTKSNATITANAVTAPDGTVTADKLVENTGTNTAHTIVQSCSFVSGTTYTVSYFVKAAERTKVMIGFDTTIIANYEYSLFDLLAGTVTNQLGTNHTHSITPFGNGWYRCSVTATATITASAGSPSLQLYTTTNVYTGDGTSGIYIWGAQLEVGAFPTSYIPSSDTFTSRASTATYVGSNGLIQSALTNVARYDYNPVNLALAPKLLLESASTNLLTYSEQFDNAIFTKHNTTITVKNVIAPDGTLTADKLVETTANSQHLLWRAYTTTTGVSYTYSVFAKAAEWTTLYLRLGGTGSLGAFDLSAVTAVASSGATSATIIPVGNGWFRCSVVGLASDAANYIYKTESTYTGDGTSGLYIWGAQLEASSFPTSYIPTVASQVTRAADISSSAQTTRVADTAAMTGTNFSSWYNQTEGTFFVKYIYGKKLASIRVCSVSDGTTSNYIDVVAASGTVPAVTSGAYLYGAVNGNAGVFSTSAGSTLINTVDTMRTFAGAYKTNDFKSCNNGGYVGVSTSSSVPVVDRLYFSSNLNSTAALLNGHISKLSYYPKRLTNSELQALTTG